MAREARDRQSRRAKIAEIRFRPFLGERASAYGTMFRERAFKILADLKELEGRGVTFSPFLEIGAGSVQRSAALMNYYSADGVATDISQGALQNAPYVLSILGCDSGPLRVCCDAHHLPFLPNTFLETPALNVFLSGLIGGNVKGLCLKSSGAAANIDFRERMMCLDCGAGHISRFEDNRETM